MTVAANDAQARMDRMYRHQRRFYDLTRRYYLLGRRHLIEQLVPPPEGTILEVGCGTASNLIVAAKRYPTAKLFGFDISTEMLATAQASVTRKLPARRISLAIDDATKFDGETLFGVATFDRIFTSYTLSMIPDWPRAIDEMARQLAPQGSLHVVDFGDCAELPRLAGSVLCGWLAKFDVTPRQNKRDVLAAAAERNDLELTFTPLFRGYAQYGVLKRR